MHLLELLCRSQVRKEILFKLKEGPKTLRELEKAVPAKKEVLARELKKTEKAGLTHRDKYWSLTEKGFIVAEAFFRFYKLLNTLEKDREFWSGAMIGQIPEKFRLELWEIGDYEVIRVQPKDIDLVERKYEEEILKPDVRWIRGVSSVYHPSWPDLYIKLAKQGKSIELVLTESVLKQVIDEYGKEILKEFFDRCKSCRIFVCKEDVKVVFVVTNCFLTLAFFGGDGEYRGDQTLWSYEKSAIRWGSSLFSYYRRRSKLLIV